MCGDILSLLPGDAPVCDQLFGMCFDDVKQVLITEGSPLASCCYCHHADALLPVDLGEVCLSGVPCADFSPMRAASWSFRPVRRRDIDRGSHALRLLASLYHLGGGRAILHTWAAYGD